MNTNTSKKLLLCYIDGMDIRSINKNNFPFLYEFLKTYPCVKITSPPSTDSLPTLLSGTYPHVHGMWGVKLKPISLRSIPDRLIDYLPDILTTTTQCLFQAFTNSFDLPAVPPRRRRLFGLTP